LAVDRFLFIGVDFFLYSTVLALLVQLGFIYHKHSAATLLSVSGNASRRLVGFTFLFFCIQLFYCFMDPALSLNVPSVLNTYLTGLYKIDYFTQMAKFFMFIIWLSLYRFLDSLAASCSQGVAEFPILSHLVLCFSLTMVSSGNFALLLICLEGFSLILYIMATIGRLHGGITAAAKYFAFGTAGSVLIL
jgi:NADH:ubiquinone oxidoreductase subunit 2 (subunit N)